LALARISHTIWENLNLWFSDLFNNFSYKGLKTFPARSFWNLEKQSAQLFCRECEKCGLEIIGGFSSLFFSLVETIFCLKKTQQKLGLYFGGVQDALRTFVSTQNRNVTLSRKVEMSP
jgi:hypothetical protein